MRTITLGRTQVHVPVMGQGTWQMGVDPEQHAREVDALRLGIECGMTLIDTAEMYADGGAERVVADAVSDRREQVFVVTKVWPTHASYDDVIRAADGSLNRLQISTIDLYLLHWPSRHAPVEETMRAMRDLVFRGVVRHVGVSNFTVDLMERARAALGDVPLAANQLPFHVRRRVIEREVLPYCLEHDITVMAYSPLGQGNFPEEGSDQRRVLDEIGRAHGATAHQVALSWVASHPGVLAIPKSSSPEHVRANAASAALRLTDEDLARIDAHFPVPEQPYETKWM